MPNRPVYIAYAMGISNAANNAFHTDRLGCFDMSGGSFTVLR